MNRGELRQRLIGLLGKDQVGDGTGYEFFTLDDLNRALNDAQRALSRDLWIPRRLAVISAKPPFALPQEGVGTRVISVTLREDVAPRRLELLTVEEAYARYPGWPDYDPSPDPPFAMIYDPGNITAPLYAIPPQTTAREYLVHYVALPVDMTADDHRPFALVDPDTGTRFEDPDLAYYDWALVYYAAYLLWDQVKDTQGQQEAMKYLAMYQRERRALAQGVAPGRLQVENSYFRTYLRRRRYGLH